MILLKILSHDLHRAKNPSGARPWFIEIPAKASFIPAIVSSTAWDRYLVNRKLTADGRMRSGVFLHDSDRLDEILGPMFAIARKLSTDEKWDNVFTTPRQAFQYIQKLSGVSSQPHMCLIPEDWTQSKIEKWAGKTNLADPKQVIAGDEPRLTYMKICGVTPCKVESPVFLSRPDFVGMYTQILGGMTSIILHNIKNGIAFCP